MTHVHGKLDAEALRKIAEEYIDSGIPSIQDRGKKMLELIESGKHRKAVKYML